MSTCVLINENNEFGLKDASMCVVYGSCKG